LFLNLSSSFFYFVLNFRARNIQAQIVPFLSSFGESMFDFQENDA
jgi:hypothetical protein